MATLSPAQFIREVRQELAKVTWPSRRETMVTTVSVIVMSAVAALFFFVADEVITGFRLGTGGAQEHFGVRADITTFGKVIGGGMPLAAFGGTRDVMAQLAPDRASQVLARGRAFGESRVVCGVHNMSAIEAGRTNAAGVFAALQGSHEFLAAMAKAREEVDLARKSSAKPDAAWCAKEAELIKPLVVQ